MTVDNILFFYMHIWESAGEMERDNKRVNILRKRRGVCIFWLTFMVIFPRRQSQSYTWFVEFCQALMRQNFHPLGYYSFWVKKKSKTEKWSKPLLLQPVFSKISTAGHIKVDFAVIFNNFVCKAPLMPTKY